MRPRGQIEFVLTSDPPREIARRAIESRRTRLPVCESDGGLNAAIGVINAKDLLPLAFGEEGFDVASIVRPLVRVAESERIDAVLREMRRRRRHLALVHDDSGAVTGLVTMEDILEQLVGEIEDEYEADRSNGAFAARRGEEAP